MRRRNILLLAWIASCLCAFAADISPTRLRCEYLDNPTQIDAPRPRFSWLNSPAEGKHGISQTAYRIRVVNSLDNSVAWDSGKIPADSSFLISYNGIPLSSATRYSWRVKVWDGRGKASGWSTEASFTTGILSDSEWQCRWIGAPWQSDAPSLHSGELSPAPLLRRSFAITKDIKSALFVGTGLGYFELYANGNKVGSGVLAPNQTNYDSRPTLAHGFIPIGDDFSEFRIPYVALDLTALLHKGVNAVGAILGNGFYNSINPAGQRQITEPYGSPRFFGQIIIRYTDGSSQIIPTDSSWKVAPSAIRIDGPFLGEIYDARFEHKGWCSASYDDSSWPAAIIRKAPKGRLFAQNGPSDAVCETFRPTSITRDANGHYVVSFPKEISGWVRLQGISGNRGDSITLHYNSETKQGQNVYVCGGNNGENYNARFTWFVFSSVTVSGWNGELTADNISACAVNSDVERTGHFSCSNSLFCDINEAYVRSQLDNMHGSIASDCPHRERTAYTGDGQVACPAAMECLDMTAFYNKWIADIRGAQIDSTGFVPNSAPWQPTAGGGIPWGAAINIIPWEFYLHYADTQVLKDNLRAMCRQVDFMSRFVKDGIMERTDSCLWVTLGDWCPPEKFVSKALIHTWYYWRCALVTAKAASVLGDPCAQRYFAIASRTKDAFNSTFFNESTGSYGPYGGNIFALAMGVPDERLPRALDALKADIAAAGGHLDTGIFGTSLFFRTLAQHGLSDLAYEAMNKTDFPSFGYWIRQGATTTWEQWDGKNSHNHPMFGGALTWFYRDVAGLRYDEAHPGFRHIIIEPKIPADLTHAEYSTLTPFGHAAVRWQRDGSNAISLSVTVPVGSTATVSLPCRDIKILAPGNVSLTVSVVGDKRTVTLPQGSYSLSAILN